LLLPPWGKACPASAGLGRGYNIIRRRLERVKRHSEKHVTEIPKHNIAIGTGRWSKVWCHDKAIQMVWFLGIDSFVISNR